MRPEDIPLLDRAILEPIIEKAASEMAEAYPEQSIEEWIEDLQLALLKGDVLIVIDDRNRRIGLVRSDRPPFLGLVTSSAAPVGVGLGDLDPDDPLGIKRWESEPPAAEAEQEKGDGGRSS